MYLWDISWWVYKLTETSTRYSCTSRWARRMQPDSRNAHLSLKIDNWNNKNNKVLNFSGEEKSKHTLQFKLLLLLHLWNSTFHWKWAVGVFSVISSGLIRFFRILFRSIELELICWDAHIHTWYTDDYCVTDLFGICL